MMDSAKALEMMRNMQTYKLWLIGLATLIAAAWFPHSLDRIRQLGYDFPIYYYWAQGIQQGDWLYKDYVLYVFKPFTVLSLHWAFGVFYFLSLLAWMGIIRNLPNNWLGKTLGLISFYPMLLSLELGQVTPILSWMCLGPIGSVLAGLVKPYCFIFSCIHLATSFLRGGNTTRQAFPVGVSGLYSKIHANPVRIVYTAAIIVGLYIAMPSDAVVATLQNKDGGLMRKGHLLYVISATILIERLMTGRKKMQAESPQLQATTHSSKG